MAWGAPKSFVQHGGHHRRIPIYTAAGSPCRHLAQLYLSLSRARGPTRKKRAGGPQNLSFSAKMAESLTLG